MSLRASSATTQHARLAVGVSAAFLLELFDGWLNFRALLLDQNAKRKRAHITDRAQQRRSHDHDRRRFHAVDSAFLLSTPQ